MSTTTLPEFIRTALVARYRDLGDSAAREDLRAGNVLPTTYQELGASLDAHLGLCEGGAEWRALRAQYPDHADAVVECASDAAAAGYLAVAKNETAPRIVPSGLMVCDACGRWQTRDPATGRPTPHTTVMGGYQLCTGRAPTGPTS